MTEHSAPPNDVELVNLSCPYCASDGELRSQATYLRGEVFEGIECGACYAEWSVYGRARKGPQAPRR